MTLVRGGRWGNGDTQGLRPSPCLLLAQVPGHLLPGWLSHSRAGWLGPAAALQILRQAVVSGTAARPWAALGVCPGPGVGGAHLHCSHHFLRAWRVFTESLGQFCGRPSLSQCHGTLPLPHRGVQVCSIGR